MTNYSERAGRQENEATTYCYKKTDQYELFLDVFKSGGSGLKPAIFWIHGGGMIFGNREMILPDQLEFYLNAGFTVISIDYRLTPESTLVDSVSDVVDAYSWVIQEESLGISSISVVGHSAGGYLALQLGAMVKSPPKALISLYGYGNLTSDWVNTPSKAHFEFGEVLKEDAEKAREDFIVTGKAFTGLKDKRGMLYMYTRQQGSWIETLLGGSKDAEKLSPALNATSKYPPTLLIHGDMDTDVPVEASIEMAEALKEAGVRCQLNIISGKGHIFDILPEGASRGLELGFVKDTFTKILSFIDNKALSS